MPKKYRAPDQLVELVRFGLSIFEQGNRPQHENDKRDASNPAFIKELPELKKDLARLAEKQSPLLVRHVDVTMRVSPTDAGWNIAPKTKDAKNHRQIARLTPLMIWKDDNLRGRFHQCKHCGRYFIGEKAQDYPEGNYCQHPSPCKDECQYKRCHPPYGTTKKKPQAKARRKVS